MTRPALYICAAILIVFLVAFRYAAFAVAESVGLWPLFLIIAAGLAYAYSPHHR